VPRCWLVSDGFVGICLHVLSVLLFGVHIYVHGCLLLLRPCRAVGLLCTALVSAQQVGFTAYLHTGKCSTSGLHCILAYW
jgi:hypothetical protein